MRHWFITGVSSGLGRALAATALAAGDLVAGTVRNEAAGRDLKAAGGARAFAYELDVTDHGRVAQIVAAADKAMGGIDVLVNNAGYSFLGTIEEASLDEIRDQFETNLFGPIAVIKAALPLMRPRRRGHIVNISSMAGITARGGVGHYGGSKLALESISSALADELAPFGIHVTAVMPGAFRTDLGHSRRSAERTIADYDEMNRERNAFLRVFSTTQRGDPVKAAEAIMAAVGAARPPRKLVLGEDAVAGIRATLTAYQAEIDAWEAVSSGTDLPNASA